jgi:hypothetical protein
MRPGSYRTDAGGHPSGALFRCADLALKTARKPLKSVSQSQKLIPAAQIKSELGCYTPERVGDAKKIGHP